LPFFPSESLINLHHTTDMHGSVVQNIDDACFPLESRGVEEQQQLLKAEKVNAFWNRTAEHERKHIPRQH
jgi:hypothetical protein